MSYQEGEPANYFPTTEWTAVIQIIQSQSGGAAGGAMARFCELYRPVVKTFFLRCGCLPAEADDYTQDFFLLKILPSGEGGGALRHAERRTLGRFRNFLCWLLKNFLRDQYRKGGLRRGNKAVHVPLEEWLELEEDGNEKAAAEFGREFDRIFALEVIQKAVARFKHSPSLLAHFRGDISQKEAADQLEISEAAFKQAYWRFRERLGAYLREEVRKIVGPDEKEIEAEIRHLISLFAAPSP